MDVQWRELVPASFILKLPGRKNAREWRVGKNFRGRWGYGRRVQCDIVLVSTKIL